MTAPTVPDRRPVNALTIDVEDWFQVENYKGVVPRDSWHHADRLDRRVVRNTESLLDLFAALGVKATFFVLGWVAYRHRDLVQRILRDGHELASHGYGHARVAALSPTAFRKDVKLAKRLLEDIGGCAVHGYRAPTFSMSPQTTAWAYAILAETGHAYSSSVFPGRHEGAASLDLTPYREQRSGLPEIPMTAVRPALLGGRTVPASGGGWFRIMPYPLFAALLRRVNEEGRRGNFYLHPWEIDPDQPMPAGVPWGKERRHRVGLASTEGRLRRLLQDFRFDRMDRAFADAIGLPPAASAAPLPSPGATRPLAAAA
jgi:polysaccharide deacetylase family protein (PEP-CTERM system associated)